jgi:hypothetical protein
MAPQQGSLFAEQSFTTNASALPTCKNVFRDHTGRFATKLKAQADSSIHKAAMYKRMWEAEVSRATGLSKRIRQMTEEINRLKIENNLFRNRD